MMRQKSILTYLIILCTALIVLFFSDDNLIIAELPELTFSMESGFYEKPFELELSAPSGAEIFYTLDGSDPDENAIKYESPIKIDDATENENIYSMRTDVSAGFLSEDIATYSKNAPQYAVPDYNIDKCTVVKSTYRNSEGHFSEIKTGVYFVGYEKKAGYQNLNVISIVTNPDNLFDYETGIYVLGQTYEAFSNGNRKEHWANSYWWWWPANYNQKGSEWERTANIQLFDTKKNLLLNKNCGIRIQGGGSRGNIPRSINLYAREQYDGEDRFYIDLFNNDYMADTITLFAGGDDYIIKLKDMLMSGLVEGRNFATMKYIPYAMFLDGEYWGVYWLTEKYNDVYLGYQYNTEENNIIMIKADAIAEGKNADLNLYKEMKNFMTNNDLSDDRNYAHACDLIDIQSYIDYFAAEIYIGRYNDWPDSNEGLWRVRRPENEAYGDGKWRWMLFDVNSGALSSALTDTDTISTTMNTSKMFYNLCQNNDFKKDFTLTFMDLVNTSFTNENVNTIISDYMNLMTEPIQMQNRRFFGSDKQQDFSDAVADVQNFLNNRKPHIVKYLKEDFSLTGTLASVELEISDTSAGKIMLNTVEPNFNEKGKWDGEYYTDYPITLTAVANEGYQFVRWEITDSAKEKKDDETIELNITEDNISIKAVYEKK